jgi:hypothetical protein
MRLGTLLVVLVVGIALTLASASGTAWAATSWVVHETTGTGEAHAQALPAAPASPAATCAAPTTAKTVKVTWTAVTHATGYTIYDSTTSATGTYASIGTATTSPWTSGALTVGTNYWFEVVANIGSNWSSVKSSATSESTIDSASPYCVQP